MKILDPVLLVCAAPRICAQGVALRLACVALALFAGQACGQGFPAKVVKIVVPFPISGPTDIRGTSRMTKTYKLLAENSPPPISDILARMVVQAIRAGSQQDVVLERQPGGATMRGAVSVARSPADGHTLLLASNGTMVINPHYFYGVQYDPVRDFVLVAPLATMPFVLLVNTGVPVDTVERLVGWLKLRPGEINYGTSGEGSTGHLAGELFRRVAGLNVVHVPYNGGLAALNGLATAQVSLMFAALPLALPYLGNEHFKALAIAGRERFELAPDLPTLAETGLTGLEVEAWYGMFAPARTPPAARVWMSERIATHMTSDASRQRLLELGLAPAMSSLAQFATRIQSETDKWAPVLRASRPPFRSGES